MTTDNKEPIKPKHDETPDLTGNNEAGDTETTTREYLKRERGNQNVQGVPVGNPVENTENEPSAEPEDNTEESKKDDRSTDKA